MSVGLWDQGWPGVGVVLLTPTHPSRTLSLIARTLCQWSGRQAGAKGGGVQGYKFANIYQVCDQGGCLFVPEFYPHTKYSGLGTPGCP